MEWLRWILLAAGVITLIGIAWIYFRHKSEQAIELGSGRTEANLDDPIDVRIRAHDTDKTSMTTPDLEDATSTGDTLRHSPGPYSGHRPEPKLDTLITPASEPFAVEPEPLRWAQPDFTRRSVPTSEGPSIDINFSDTDGIIGAVRRTTLTDPALTNSAPESDAHANTASPFTRGQNTDQSPPADSPSPPSASDATESTAQQPGGLFQHRQGPGTPVDRPASRRFSYQENPQDATPGPLSEPGATPPPLDQEESHPVVIPLLIASSNGDPFAADRVQGLIEEIGFEFGEFSIYHYPGEMGTPLFSLMNGVKPGTFDRGNVTSFSTPLLAIFMQLPLQSPSESLIFERMLDVARDIADQLDGELLDDQRQPLSSESIDRYREQLNG